MLITLNNKLFFIILALCVCDFCFAQCELWVLVVLLVVVTWFEFRTNCGITSLSRPMNRSDWFVVLALS